MRIGLSLVFGLGVGVILAACPAPRPPPSPPPPPPSRPEQPARLAAGARCRRGGECESGICEGQGCGAPGVCAARDRPCTRDMRPYCGCDGRTFYASGTCPNALYAHRGACDEAREVGSQCTVAAQCASGICEGEGCGDELGVCAPAERACTQDVAVYCGCDGATFESSGSCPGRRFAHRGRCETKKRALGQPCIRAKDCASGICEGEGCGDENGVCVSRQRRCTMDLRPYCGCDGMTFRTSGSCPGRRYRHRGACKDRGSGAILNGL